MARKSKLPEGTESAALPRVIMTADAFRTMDAAETYSGLNILKLNPGQAAGPLTVKEVLPDQDLGGGTGKRKIKPVDVYVAIDPDGIEVRLPVAQSLTQKLKDAKIGAGDVIAILRGDDYVSKVYKTKGASYELKVISRATAEKKGKK